MLWLRKPGELAARAVNMAMQQFLKKAQSTAVSRPQLPNSGEAYVMTHPQYGPVTEGMVNNLMGLGGLAMKAFAPAPGGSMASQIGSSINKLWG